LGVGLAALAGSFLAPVIGWRATFMVSGVSALLVVFIRKGVAESDVWQMARDHPETSARMRTWRTVVALAGEPLRRRTLRAFVLTTLNMSAYWIPFTWLPTYRREERGLSVARSGLWVLVIVCGELAGYLSFGAVSDRWGRKRAFTAFACLMGSGLLAITLGWNWVASSTPLLLGAMAGVG